MGELQCSPTKRCKEQGLQFNWIKTLWGGGGRGKSLDARTLHLQINRMFVYGN